MKHLIIVLTLVLAVGLSAADKAKTISLSISGMTCEACANTVQKALKRVDGVKDASVNLKKSTATVTLAKATTTSETLIGAVVRAGYTATEAKAGMKQSTKKMKMDGEDCDGDCCDDAGHAKGMKAKKTEQKKS